MQTLSSNSLETEQPPTTEPFLVIDNVSKIYPTQGGGTYTVLDGVNLKVNESEFISVIGHSGCGKSTMLDMVSGFRQPSTGEVRLRSKPITQPGPIGWWCSKTTRCCPG